MADSKDPSLTPDVRFQLIRRIEAHKILGLAGTVLAEHEAKYLEFHQVAGVILFDRNVESLSQTADLIGRVEEILGSSGRPPLVMADHEGDFISELKTLIGVPPSLMAIAATGDAKMAYEVAVETGEAMSKLGVNVVLAPVADLYLDRKSPITGLRSFGSDPHRVANLVAHTLRGFSDAGIATCVKHFPGHGSTADDSHTSLPIIDKSIEELWECDLVPFARAVEAEVDIVMTAHVAFAGGDDKAVPASFSRRWVNQILRKDLGFDGVVITDALEMEGARQHARNRYGGIAGGVEHTLLAGSDLLLYASPVPERMTVQEDGEPMIAAEVMQTVIETLHKVVDHSRITKKLELAASENEGLKNLLAIIDASDERVNRLREQVGANKPPESPKAEGNVIHLNRYATAPAIYKTVADRSIVLVRDPQHAIPVAATEPYMLLPIEYSASDSLKSQDLVGFMDALCRPFEDWRPAGRVVGFDTDPSGHIIPVLEAVDRQLVLDAQRATGDSTTQMVPEEVNVVPVVSARGYPGDDFLDLFTTFLEQQQIPLVIMTATPFHTSLPESVGCLLTLGASPAVAASAASILMGITKPRGNLIHVLGTP